MSKLIEIIFWLVGAVIFFIVAAYILAAVVWLSQWIFAIPVWIFQIVIMPLFLYFMPATLTSIAIAGFMVGAWTSARNYLRALHNETQPEEWVGRIFKGFMTLTAPIILTIVTAAVILASGLTQSSADFIEHVRTHYTEVAFPAYEIYFPFWSRMLTSS